MNGILLALLTGSALLVSPAADKDVVRESWAGSGELPTAIAYYEFTRLLADTRSTPHAYAHLLADALGVRNVDALGQKELRGLQSHGEIFLAHYRSMQLEVLETRIRMLCSPSAARRASRSAAYATMNAADDVSRPIQQKFLALAVAGLSAGQKHAFRSFLGDFKSSVSYVKLDNRPGNDAVNAIPDPGAALARACTDMQAEYADALQQGGQ